MDDAINTFGIGDEHPDVEVVASGKGWHVAKQGDKVRFDVETPHCYRAVPLVRSPSGTVATLAPCALARLESEFRRDELGRQRIAEMRAAMAALNG